MDEQRLGRLRYRAWRRGFTEADLILGRFTDAHARGLTPTQLDSFEALLDQDDHDLYDWILGRKLAPPALDGEMLAMIRTFSVNGARQSPDA